MIKYVIFQNSTYWSEGGYYTGKTYIYQHEMYGCFVCDVENAKKYKSKKVAQKVINEKIHFLGNGNKNECKIEVVFDE